jgi:hypothetical protein
MIQTKMKNYNPDNNTRKCCICKEWKDLSNFKTFVRKGYKNVQYRALCTFCQKESMQNFVTTPSKYTSRQHILEKRASDPRKSMWGAAKRRAKKKGIEFTILPEDIIIPKLCPLLEIPLVANTRYTSGLIGTTDNSPSLDRKDNNRGYTPDNIWVVSYKANAIKNNGSIEDLTLLLKNLIKSCKIQI